MRGWSLLIATPAQGTTMLRRSLDDNGGGIGLDSGYGFRNPLPLFLTMSGAASMQPGADKLGASYALGEVDLGARFEVGNVVVRVDPEDAFDVRTTRLQIGVRHDFSSD